MVIKIDRLTKGVDLEVGEVELFVHLVQGQDELGQQPAHTDRADVFISFLIPMGNVSGHLRYQSPFDF